MIKNRPFLAKVFGVLSFLLLILLSGSPLQTIILNINNLIFVVLGLSLLLFLCLKKRPHRIQTIGLILLSFMVFATAIVHFGGELSSHVKLYCFILSGFFIAQFFDARKFASFFVDAMFFLAIIGIIGYFLSNTTILLDRLPLMTNSNGVSYKIGYIFNFIVESKVRNCGPFWEPGIFASYLIISLFMELLILKRKKTILFSIIFVIALITTTSTAGYFLLLLIVPCFFLNSNKKSAISTIFSGCVVVALFLILLNLDSIILGTGLSNNEYFAKLLSENLENSARVTALSHNFIMFSKSPLFGCGFAVVEQNMVYCGDISTSTYILSVYGFMGIFYSIMLVFGIFNFKRIGFLHRLLFASAVLLIVNKEPHTSFLITWIFIFVMLPGSKEENSTVRGKNLNASLLLVYE